MRFPQIHKKDKNTMCTMCNSSCYQRRSGCNCGCNCGCGNGFLAQLFDNTQCVCRDCCGNIRVREGACGTYNNNACSCHFWNAWSGCNGNSTNSANNANTASGNGNACVTVCGEVSAVSNTASGNGYSPRRCGCSRRSSCCYNG